MFLWESIAFGPIHSRRLGSSLGINVSPTDVKICSFDCVYCECGWTLEKDISSTHFHPASLILQAIEKKLKQCQQDEIHIDSITFSGNGEPTLHPQFGEIIDGLLKLRDQYYPTSAITCLTNSTRLGEDSVRNALLKIDNPMLKLDAGLPDLYQLINRPILPVTLEETVQNLSFFKNNLLIQSMFLKGEVDGVAFDNTSEENVSAWVDIIKKLKPKRVLIYSLDRETPATKLKQISKQELELIAERVRAYGIRADIY